ncbi:MULTISPECIES: type IV pili methyl-accepting chemotaxis transducer N-terminal domain-containing protein [unclassified Pseudoalteromonas]|uniref:type IV pili methyl-accepting chemotaxis transducer N-terminal domain-containing protein n=1 Tax=unclassified Pseudoalteromonas TaxID=194690 RepID=UPI002359CDD6|nr:MULTISPECIES: type IV pili methyl-accepting chemotaxis transducer N-terminal domain-containing protein [unclassified Pseudoalteromonas]MDC9564459.1 type IV pili methyl-accepting chemotaxis transducer N-terminal domain-containing protein [Pseudoalteromonas sp. GAB2316C]MDC9568964.1 type IV pili methyl-accepting chemotaxis transducer N-terminal domain-containing protein [Pseudoalteromonas sp. GABNB9D]MDC9573133.1 type IV pili methyl-accepting chemotaxis transducer N-terminal domain-containing p
MVNTDFTNKKHGAISFVYIVPLTVIAVLSVCIHFMLDEVIDAQTDTGKLVNVSGQQRMLSQRVSMFTLEYLMYGSQDSKLLAINALNSLKNNHKYLLSEPYGAQVLGDESPLSKELLAMYFKEPINVDKKLSMFSDRVEEVLKLKTQTLNLDTAQESFFSLAKEPLLKAFNTVVMQYEKESVDRVKRLHTIQGIVIIVILLSILVEFLLVYKARNKKHI